MLSHGGVVAHPSVSSVSVSFLHGTRRNRSSPHDGVLRPARLQPWPASVMRVERSQLRYCSHPHQVMSFSPPVRLDFLFGLLSLRARNFRCCSPPPVGCTVLYVSRKALVPEGLGHGLGRAHAFGRTTWATKSAIWRVAGRRALARSSRLHHQAWRVEGLGGCGINCWILESVRASPLNFFRRLDKRPVACGADDDK